ncbi:PQQ-dependent sugar dehydrogenase [Hymenobacter sp. DH14]|uniref:PQQ-dependent sugar dehydrogenase n=1 Tax=Hymenobacter cyanobacteriorum TaxID=2926463 RepID=A0A9X1VFZ8_9BACT|nr:PQQ-dependent sugar dehydrogenase [Hymenobacter cyanobacteriorum]MCI1188206.1 PQQ-dependent sugar dehydrogenase [Hymenobacter cyanobacteriorum]
MKLKLLRRLALALGAALPQVAAAQAPALTTFPVGTTTVTASALASNLSTIWELVWGPDNFIWMTERSGRISRVNPTTGQVLPLLTIPDVTESNESGLLGLAVLVPAAVPASTSYLVFVVYNYTDQGVLKEKLVRYTYTNGTLGSPVVLLGNIVATTTHSGSRLLLLPDNTLLMTTGDAQQQPQAQNLASLNGKILRLNLDGTIPANNPTPGSPVYTLGHRNPQGLVQLPNGRIYSSEHGPNNDDEINKIEAGRNYGWPTVEGYCDLPAEATFCTANNVREPLTTWTPTIAPAGLAYYDHPAIPGWRGSLLLAVLKGSRLTQLTLDAAGLAIPTRTDYLTGFGRLRAVCVSPQGRVYVGTSNRDGRGNPAAADDRILVLENRAYTATATRPAADFSFGLFPNPARRLATVQLPTAGYRLQVADLLGRMVLSQPPGASATAVLDLAALRAGTYLVQADGPAGRATRRLVVE